MVKMPSDSLYTFDDGEVAITVGDVPLCRDVAQMDIGILAGPIHTQAGAERLLPALAQCKGVARWIGAMIEPRGEIDILKWIPCKCSRTDHAGWNGPYVSPTGRRNLCQECDGQPYRHCVLDRVIVRGREQPMHPDWVCSIRDQCKAAGVPFWFDGWGEWLPFDQVKTEEQRCEFSLATRRGEQSYFGAKVTWGPQGPKTGTTHNVRPVSYARVGATISGRTLNGREHRGEV